MTSFNEQLEGKEGFIYSGSVNRVAIDNAEKELGIRFADDYRDYLCKYGCASYSGHELTGICQSEQLNVISATKRLHDFFPDIPSDLYVIEETHMDDIVYWQDAHGIIYRTVANSKPVTVCSSLQSYISIP